MSERYHTVILVPHSRAKMRKWRISSRQLRVATAIALTSILLSGASLWHFLRTQSSGTGLDLIENENRTLRQANQSIDSTIRRLQQQLARSEERTRQLSIAAGIAALPSNAGTGVGGDSVAGQESYESFLESVEIRNSELSRQLDQVESSLENQQERLSATPTIAPVKGILTCGFGYRRDPFTGRPAFHPAIDISAPAGYPISAPADGIVLLSGASGALGKAVALSHGFGLTTRYGHLSQLNVRPGDRVKRGEVIGKVGNSGRATGFHLHYEVHVDGQAVDPMSYILADELAHR